MLFVLGIIVGMSIMGTIVSVLIYFRSKIEPKLAVMEKIVENAGPRPKGFIVEPISEADEIRDEVIAKNREKGEDTPIKDLR